MKQQVRHQINMAHRQMGMRHKRNTRIIGGSVVSEELREIGGMPPSTQEAEALRAQRASVEVDKPPAAKRACPDCGKMVRQSPKGKLYKHDCTGEST